MSFPCASSGATLGKKKKSGFQAAEGEQPQSVSNCAGVLASPLVRSINWILGQEFAGLSQECQADVLGRAWRRVAGGLVPELGLGQVV